TITYSDVTPAIAITKSADPTSVSEGGVDSQSVTYTYLRSNTSTAEAYEPLSAVTGSDSDGTPVYVSGDTNSDGMLNVGETWTYTLTVNAAPQNAGTTHSNTATATATDYTISLHDALPISTITYSDVTPAIAITKSADPTSVSEGGVDSQSVTYTYL